MNLSFLYKPVSSAPLVNYRLIFGGLMIFSTLRFMYLGWIEDHYTDPVFHFSYWGFEWVTPLSPVGMYAVHLLMVAAAAGVMLATGLWYRMAAIVLFITFTYTELIDLTYYLNHYYFVSLVCLLLCLLPGNQSVLNYAPGSKIPRWAVLILQFQIAVVYIYAGLAKINYDWLINALPLKIWLPANDTLPIIGPIFSLSVTSYLFSWIGMLYDCFIVVFLIYKPTRLWAFATVVVFHLLTGLLFQIGVFPLVMVGGVIIFFSEQWHEKLSLYLNSFFRKKNKPVTPVLTGTGLYHRIIPKLLMAYVIFQLLFPWRYLLYSGNHFWTEEGYRFGWRVMLMEKAGTATFYVKDSETGREGVVVNSEFLNPHQEKQMAMQPDMIMQYGHFLGRHYENQGVKNPQVRAEVYVTLNGRPSQLLIDPEVNLMTLRDTPEQKHWILPLRPNTGIATR